jgi:predicted amidohydrolase
VVVLPELATSGYMFADAEEARAAALTSADSAFTKWSRPLVIRLSSAACELGDDARLYNSAVMVDTDGVIATYQDPPVGPGEADLHSGRCASASQDEHGAIAVMVCYDLSSVSSPAAPLTGRADHRPGELAAVSPARG